MEWGRAKIKLNFSVLFITSISMTVLFFKGLSVLTWKTAFRRWRVLFWPISCTVKMGFKLWLHLTFLSDSYCIVGGRSAAAGNIIV